MVSDDVVDCQSNGLISVTEGKRNIRLEGIERN